MKALCLIVNPVTCPFSSIAQVGRLVAVRNDGEDVLVKWKGLDYGE